jgi:hypothetical protein
MKNRFLLSENEVERIKSLHKRFGYRSGLLTEAEYLNQDRPGDPFQYLKVDDGTTTKYYFKGIKGTPLTKYPNWTEAKGNNLEKIKELVTFKTQAETTSLLSGTQKTDEELYTEYFNNEFKKIKPETLPKGKITKLADGTYGYVLDDGTYTLLSDGYSVNKDGVKSTNKWTETVFVKPAVSTVSGALSGAGAVTDAVVTQVITNLSEYLKSKYPTVQVPQTVLDTLKTLLTGIDTATITKIVEFLTTKTGTIEEFLKLIPDTVKNKVLEALKSIPNLIAPSNPTEQPKSGQVTLF